jgi:hypothetical protein
MESKKKIEHLVIKERTNEVTLIYQFVRGLRSLTETAFLISVGAMATLWERFGKILNSKLEEHHLGRIITPDSSAPPEGKEPQGKVKVPLLPIDNYRQLSADQIIRKLKGFSHEELELIRQFESSHKNRKSLLEAVDRSLSGIKS